MIEIEKLTDYVRRSHPIKIDDISIDSIELEYVCALIESEQFDRACDILSRNIFAAIDYLWIYCDKMRSKRQLVELAKQLDDIEAQFKEQFQRRGFEYENKFTVYRSEAAVMGAIENEDLNQAIDLIRKLERADHEYWIQTLNNSLGEQAARKLIDVILDEVTHPKAKSRRSKEFFDLLKPTPQRPPSYRENSLARKRGNLEVLNKLERESKTEWLEKATFKYMFFAIPKEHQPDLLEKILKAIGQAELSEAKLSEYRWRMIDAFVAHNKWDLLLETIKGPLPLSGYGGSSNYTDLLKGVKEHNPERLAEFVLHLPDANEELRYEHYLIDLLLSTGHISKAARNVHSLEEAFLDQYNLKVEFYETLHATKFNDAKALGEIFNKVLESEKTSDYVSPFYFMKHVLGDDFLADIVEHGNPETALEVARNIPKEFMLSSRRNPLGRCVLPLILRGKTELALEVGRLATLQERETGKLDGKDGRWVRKIAKEDWEPLEEILPNDPRVLRQLIANAVMKKDKQRALQLAFRTTFHNREVWDTSVFAKAGWVEELLDVAKKVEKLKSSDPYFARLQQRTAMDVGEFMEFADADEAIEFASRYIHKRHYKTMFLLGLANSWKD